MRCSGLIRLAASVVALMSIAGASPQVLGSDRKARTPTFNSDFHHAYAHVYSVLPRGEGPVPCLQGRPGPGLSKKQVMHLFANHGRLQLGKIDLRGLHPAFDAYLVDTGPIATAPSLHKAQGPVLGEPGHKQLAIVQVLKQPIEIPKTTSGGEGGGRYLTVASGMRYGVGTGRGMKPVTLVHTDAVAVLREGTIPDGDLVFPSSARGAWVHVSHPGDSYKTQQAGRSGNRGDGLGREESGDFFYRGLDFGHTEVLGAFLSAGDRQGSSQLSSAQVRGMMNGKIHILPFGAIEQLSALATTLPDLQTTAQVFLRTGIVSNYGAALLDMKGPGAAATKQLVTALGHSEALGLQTQRILDLEVRKR